MSEPEATPPPEPPRVYTPITLDPNTPVVPHKRKPGRPKGAKNKKKPRGNLPGIFPKGGFVSGDPRQKPGSKDRAIYHPSREQAWRMRLKRAKELVLSEEVIKDLFCEAIAIAKTYGHPEQARMIEFCVEQAVGKASSKLEVDSQVTNVSIDQKIAIFKRITGLATDAIIDGTVAGAVGDGHQGDREELPALPAPLHLQQGEDQGAAEAGAVRTDVRPFVVEPEEEGVREPAASADQ